MAARQILDRINISALEQRSYLFYGCYANYYENTGWPDLAITYLEKAIQEVSNDLEKSYLIKKRDLLQAGGSKDKSNSEEE